MAIRIEPKLDNTEELLAQILRVILKDEQRVAFLCPAGRAAALLARLRVMTSRKRKVMAAKGLKAKQFRTRASVHAETHNGIRHDCIVMWRETNDSTFMSEVFEDLMSNG